MTDAEIQDARQGIFDEIRAREDRRVEGIDGCMKWLFMRHDAGQPWQAFGYMYGKYGVVKLNGALRTTAVSYSIPAEPHYSLLGTRHGPSKKPGYGGMHVSAFEEKPTFSHWRAAVAADEAMDLQLVRGTHGADARYLRFGSTTELRVSSKDASCTLVKARCRRYTLPVNRPAEWVGNISSSVANRNDDYVTEPIGMAPGLKLELAIEDMCPFSRLALVEAPVNTRGGGAEPGVRKYGLGANASLKEALRPYAQEVKR